MTDDDEILIAKISRKEDERLQIAIRSYRGHRFIDVRTFRRGDDGTAVPTPKGVTLNGPAALELASALDRAVRALEAPDGMPPAEDDCPI